MIEILEKRLVRHYNGMVHHSLKYLERNTKKLMALVERPFKKGRQATLIKASYNQDRDKWVADDVRFFYDGRLCSDNEIIDFDEMYEDAIIKARVEYIGKLASGVVIDKKIFDEIMGFPVNEVEYQPSSQILITPEKNREVNVSTLDGLDTSGYNVFWDGRLIPENSIERNLINIVRDNIVLYPREQLRKYPQEDVLDPDGVSTCKDLDLWVSRGPEMFYNGRIYRVDMKKMQ